MGNLNNKINNVDRKIIIGVVIFVILVLLFEITCLHNVFNRYNITSLSIGTVSQRVTDQNGIEYNFTVVSDENAKDPYELEAERLWGDGAKEEEIVEDIDINEDIYGVIVDYSYIELMDGNYYSPSTGYSDSYGDGVLTRSGGVNYYNGYRETWYSSNQLYHYRTNEWTVDSNGVYRDSNGYVVVASSDLGQGSTVETSHGTGMVYDSGCASGTIDIYTQW